MGPAQTGPTRVWESRTGAVRADLLAYSQSVADDAPLTVHDLAGSVAHVAGLAHVGLLTPDEARQLTTALRGLLQEHEAGRFTLDPALEDLHMNIEARLTAQLGDVGRKLHTGRSRNDQVATCITLYAREHLADVAQAATHLVGTLARRAREHAATPWVARTHGQNAQPATLGFLLAAHACRMADVAQAALQAFTAVGEAPLGSGAVAGSTLPLDPAYTAGLMGLRPPRSAILATGTRDTVLAVTQVAAQAGFAGASLAQDLLELYAQKALALDAGYTTGSSLMPQKRNPDSLELARANGKRLGGVHAAATATLSGLGLGYHRDFQLTKPMLVDAATTAQATLEMLEGTLATASFDAARLGAGLADPGLVATDIAEALVGAGLPFRTAYATAARAFADVEGGATISEALRNQALSPAQLAAALSATTPDPAKRATVGGTAPVRVLETVAAVEASLAALAPAVAQAQADAETPFRLLEP